MNVTAARLTSALIGAAAIGSLALGMAGTAGADAGNQPAGTTHYTVTNKSKTAVVFTGYGKSWDSAATGPKPNYTVKPGQSVDFGITVWSNGGHMTQANFMVPGDYHAWDVDMKASSAENQAVCSANAGCSPTSWTNTTQITLY